MDSTDGEEEEDEETRHEVKVWTPALITGQRSRLRRPMEKGELVAGD